MLTKDSEKLPRRDYVILPLISLLTILLLLGGAEVFSRYWFAESSAGNCSTKDPLHRYRFTPNSVCHRKAAEGVMVEYAYNECGYRTRESCGPKPVNSLRVALMGASTSEGFKVPYEDAFAPRIATTLSKQCRRPVELQNMGVAGYKPIDQYWLIPEALALKPDLIMLVVSPYELEDTVDPKVLENRRHPEVLLQEQAKPADLTHKQTTLISMIDATIADSRAVLAAQHMVYQNREKYIALFLMHGDKADYLREPLSPAWEKRMEMLDLLLGEMADTTHAAGVPFMLVLGSQRIQTALLDPKTRPAGTDPFQIGRRVAQIAAKHGIIFMDTLPAFAATAQPEQLFFPVDGHMTEAGHALFANAISQRLLDGTVAPFSQCAIVSGLPQ